MPIQLPNDGTVYTFKVSGRTASDAPGIITGTLSATTSNPNVLTLSQDTTDPLNFLAVITGNGEATITVTEAPKGITSNLYITIFDPALVATSLVINAESNKPIQPIQPPTV